MSAAGSDRERRSTPSAGTTRVDWRGMIPRLAWLLGWAALASGCDGTISVTFFTGPQVLSLSSANFVLPSELEDDAGNIANVPCGPTGMCPSNGHIAISCEANVCDPSPTTLSAGVGDVIDLDALLAETRDVGVRSIESYTIEEVRYGVRLNTLAFDVGPIEIYWGPAAATSIDPALGVHRLGTVPVVARGSTPEGTVELDEAGVAALSAYLVETGARVRFFAQTVIDLDPGDPFPEGGSVEVGVNLTITAVARVID